MSIGAGEFNRTIFVDERVDAVDAANQPIENWIERHKLRSKILGANGMSAVRSAQEGIELAPGRYSFRIRFRPVGITTGMRVRDRLGFIFDIKDIRHDLDRREWTDLVCETGANNG